MKIGITGTRHGWTPEQEKTFNAWICQQDIEEFHHGDCNGVDAQAAEVVEALYALYVIHCHPPLETKWRAFFGGGTIYKKRAYIKRNHDIVDAVDVVVVIPKTPNEVARGSGTWATYRYACQMCKRTILIRPDGVMYPNP